jgi:DNA-directed RNA polymerase sigma subunit (sigma70/sigma32)
MNNPARERQWQIFTKQFGGDRERVNRVLDALGKESPKLDRHIKAFRLYFGLSGEEPLSLTKVGKRLRVGDEGARQLRDWAGVQIMQPRWAKHRLG